jgi:hypothetical protein
MAAREQRAMPAARPECPEKRLATRSATLSGSRRQVVTLDRGLDGAAHTVRGDASADPASRMDAAEQRRARIDVGMVDPLLQRRERLRIVVAVYSDASWRLSNCETARLIDPRRPRREPEAELFF